jgi:uncharacterized membrane protein
MLILTSLLLLAISAIFILFIKIEPSEELANTFLALFVCFWVSVGFLFIIMLSLHQSAQYWEAQFWKNDKLAADLLREKEKERLKYAKFIYSKGYSLDSLDSINISNPK